ncbi:MAG: hypothetical protein ACYSUI_21045 [Planctomycetota bacterium]|jgi:hypothetical protein
MTEAEIIDAATGEVIVAQPTDALTEFGSQEFGLARAKSIADTLAAIIREKNLAVKIGHGEHLRVEAWCACASMVGVAPKTEWTKEVRNPATGELEGYMARVQVVQIANSNVIGAAEAGCFFDEKMRGGPRWTDRHAVLSMAQTRSTSKALGQILRWLPVLAGFSGTPAEEMPPPMADAPGPQKPVPQPRRKKATAAQIKMLKAVSYTRADEIMDVCAAKEMPLKHQDQDSLAASIRKHAMIATGVDIAELKGDEVDPLKHAIESAETDPEGDVVIPGEDF